MKDIKKFNEVAFECIRKSNQCHWNGTTVHDNLEKAFVGMNLFLGLNSGSYIPKVIKINGAYGYYMINESGRVCFEGRVIKKDEKKFLIEYISNSEYEKIENKIYQELT